MAVGRFCVGVLSRFIVHNNCFRNFCMNNIEVAQFQTASLAEYLLIYVRVLQPLVVGIFTKKKKMLLVFFNALTFSTLLFVHFCLAYILHFHVNLLFVMFLFCVYGGTNKMLIILLSRVQVMLYNGDL